MIIPTLLHLYLSECPEDPNYYARTRQKRARALRAPVLSLSPGAWMTCEIQMTASSPTPQQQNRWKGRRCLAAALIPQPAAYPPVRTPFCLSFRDTCFALSPQAAPERVAATRSSSDLSAKLCHSDKKKKGTENPRQACVFFRRIQRRRSASSLHLTSGTHIARGRANNSSVTRLKGRRQIPQ